MNEQFAQVTCVFMCNWNHTTGSCSLAGYGLQQMQLRFLVYFVEIAVTT